MPITPNSFQQLAKLAPSNAILRMALLKCVSGMILQMGCNQEGKASIEKKVPANKNCGSVIKLAKGGMVLSFLAMLLTMNPKPMNKIKETKLNNMISIKV
jgi:hypothetical protein